MIRLLNKFLIPFAIVHLRIIQHRYKKITINNYHNRSNSNYAKLELLQAKEYYYHVQFDSWGKFHPRFSYNQREYLKHYRFMEWLFPQKTFEEWDLVIQRHPKAITYYQNKIFTLKNEKSTPYHIEIQEQMRKWRKQEQKSVKNICGKL